MPAPADDLISVIVPAHNVERFIGQTLQSVLHQTHRALEVIVVDDGSSDRTAEIVAAFAERDPRVRLIRTHNVGVSAARNLAIAQSRGPFIATLDADDIWRRDKLARQLAVMRASGPEIGVVYCWSAGIDERNRIILPSWNNSVAAGNVLLDIVVSGIAGNGSTPLMRRKYVEAAGGYDAELTLCEDWKFYTALAGVCEFAVVPEYLTGYRLHLSSASVNVLPMEQAIAGVTAWIVRTWPWLPRERARGPRLHGLRLSGGARGQAARISSCAALSRARRARAAGQAADAVLSAALSPAARACGRAADAALAILERTRRLRRCLAPAGRGGMNDRG